MTPEICCAPGTATALKIGLPTNSGEQHLTAGRLFPTWTAGVSSSSRRRRGCGLGHGHPKLLLRPNGLYGGTRATFPLATATRAWQMRHFGGLVLQPAFVAIVRGFSVRWGRVLGV